MTPEQRTYARLAGLCFLLYYGLQGAGDIITLGRLGSADFADTARWATESAVLYRVALMFVASAWIASTMLAFALYVLLEPVNKRLAQLALVMRLGASFVAVASLMFRAAWGWLLQASATPGLFTIDQLSTLAAVNRRAAGGGFSIAMVFLGAASVLFFLLFVRSAYLPRALARFGVFASALLVLMGIGMFVYPANVNELKLLGGAIFFTEVATGFILLFKGVRPRAGVEP